MADHHKLTIIMKFKPTEYQIFPMSLYPMLSLPQDIVVPDVNMIQMIVLIITALMVDSAMISAMDLNAYVHQNKTT